MTSNLLTELEMQARDAARYNWLRRRIALSIIKRIEGNDFTGDGSPERMNQIIDERLGHTQGINPK